MRHITDLRADVVKFPGPKHRDMPARRLVESSQSAQQRSLARSVVAKNGIEFAAGEFRRNPAQRRKPAKLLDQVRDCDDGGGFSGIVRRNLRMDSQKR
jgi:hypothetical protein